MKGCVFFMIIILCFLFHFQQANLNKKINNEPFCTIISHYYSFFIIEEGI
jgi:hypothetical protein